MTTKESSKLILRAMLRTTGGNWFVLLESPLAQNPKGCVNVCSILKINKKSLLPAQDSPGYLAV
jgi:hypothetical protein